MAARAGFRAGAIATVALLTARATLAQNTAVTGARVTVIEKNTGVLSVTLENLRDAPLVAWEIGLVRPGLPEPPAVQTADFTQPWRYEPDDGPVAPRERRVVNIRLGNIAEGSAAVVNLAVFVDGYYEGQPESVKKFRQRRQQQVADLRYWVGVMEQMPLGSNDAIRVFLREQLVRHASRPGASDSSFAGNLRGLTVEDVQRPPGWITGMLKHRVSEAREYLARLEQPLTSGPEWLAGSVDSVAVSSAPAPGGALYARLENARDVPIEAIGVRYSSGGSMTSDYCTSMESPPGHGPIRPGETREMLLPNARSAGGTLPNVTVTFVLFADLKFEGRREDVNELLRARERRAAAAAFSIAVLSEAILLQPDKILSFSSLKARPRVATPQHGKGHRSPSKSTKPSSSLRPRPPR
jgi:hypothetical protein